MRLPRPGWARRDVARGSAAQTNPLDGARVVHNATVRNQMYQYFVKVVPTQYRDLGGRLLRTNQFSVTEHVKDVDLAMGRNLPGVFVFYDINPIQARFSPQSASGFAGCASGPIAHWE